MEKVTADGEGNTAVVTLDDAIPDTEVISLIKCDAEGMEAEVIKGAAHIIERDKPVLHLEDDKPEYSEALFNTLQGFGYDIWWHPVPLFRNENPAGNPENIFPRVYSLNLLGAHPDNPIGDPGLKRLTTLNEHPLLKNRD